MTAGRRMPSSWVCVVLLSCFCTWRSSLPSLVGLASRLCFQTSSIRFGLTDTVRGSSFDCWRRNPPCVSPRRSDVPPSAV